MLTSKVEQAPEIGEVGEILWQGKFMDGVLQVITTEAPSIFSFRINAYSGRYEGIFYVELGEITYKPADAIVAEMLKAIEDWYIARIKLELEASGGMLQ